jgi:hypothetical protein
MKLLFKPFGAIAGLIAGWLGRNIFKAIWAQIDETEPPPATAPHASMGKVVGAKALEAATLAGVAAAADRMAARAFHHLTGYWPGKDPKPK